MNKKAILTAIALTIPSQCLAQAMGYYEAREAERQKCAELSTYQQTEPVIGSRDFFTVIQKNADAERCVHLRKQWKEQEEIEKASRAAALAREAEWERMRPLRIAVAITAAIAFALTVFGLWRARRVIARVASGIIIATGAGAIIAIRKSVRTVAALRAAMVEQADRRDGQP